MTIDEVTAQIPRRVRGQVRLYPQAVVNHPIVLDEVGNHCWWPIAPCARVEAGEARVPRTLEDGRFCARSILDTTLLGHRSEAVHESPSLDRSRNPIVETFLPRRMPREGW